MASVPGLLSGNQPWSDEELAQMTQMEQQVPGLLAPVETPEQAEAAVRASLKRLDWNRTMAPESGYAARPEPIKGGPAYGLVGGRAGPVLSPTEQQYWQDYAVGLADQNSPQDSGSLPRILREAQRVAPIPLANYQSPYDLYQMLQMNPQTYNDWVSRRAQQAFPIPSR